MSFFTRKSKQIPTADQAMADRSAAIEVTGDHFVLDAPYVEPFPEGTDTAVFGMGCFWGAERLFWRIPGVVTTAVGYAGGHTANPTYADVCSGRTGHTEVVLVVFDPDQVTYDELLRSFWEEHDPTQGMRQGNDVGTQYRSAIYWFDEKQRLHAESSRDRYQSQLTAAGLGTITTEIAQAATFFYAEEYHQQYHAKNLAKSGMAPSDLAAWYVSESPVKPLPVEGYCGMEPTGVSCPIGLGVDADPAES